jgi:hypothetical protein
LSLFRPKVNIALNFGKAGERIRMATIEGQGAVNWPAAGVPSSWGGGRSSAISAYSAAGAAFGWGAIAPTPPTPPLPDPPPDRWSNGAGGRRAPAPTIDGPSSQPGPNPPRTPAAAGGSGSGAGGGSPFGGRLAAATAFFAQMVTSVASGLGTTSGRGDTLTRLYASRAYARPATGYGASFDRAAGIVLPPLASGRAIDLSV